MASFEALYGRRCRSPIIWFEPGEAKLYGTDLVRDALKKVNFIQEQLHTTQSRQKSYVDQKKCDLSFVVGEKFLLKVSPMKGVMRFRKRGKLSPRIIGLFEVLRKVGEVTYKLVLPSTLSGIHLVIHVPMIRRCHTNRSYVLYYSTVQLDENLGYEEKQVAIVDKQAR
ncbi:uncharacterized protein [Nicotiana sylvestris]|uniref:uncharacterized protein n=1 Tax=Nicotiana sylvestris TaxID=4096 RepID=UPI00388CC49D